jgi:sugar transferase (PEP-CTERM/EpsH1 system associated)
MIARLPLPEPSSMGYFYSARLAGLIDEALASQPFDLIMVHCSSVAQYVENVIGIPKVLDFGDMDSQKWLTYSRFRGFPLSAGYFLEGTKLQRAEIALARKFDFCACTTQAELETLQGYRVPTPCGWFPNGVDLTYFQTTTEPYAEDSICFVGRMDYYPNQQAVMLLCQEILPLIRQQRPHATVSLVGASPSPQISKLALIPGVTVTGTVPDVRPHAHRAAVMVAPLRIARGTQNKILEAMAMGIPVVTSPEAAKGVDVVAGEHLLVADDPQRCADAVVRVLADHSERQRLATAGRQRVEERHSWNHAMQTLDRLLDGFLANLYSGGRLSA